MYTDCIPYISSLIGYIIEVTPLIRGEVFSHILSTISILEGENGVEKFSIEKEISKFSVYKMRMAIRTCSIMIRN